MMTILNKLSLYNCIEEATKPFRVIFIPFIDYVIESLGMELNLVQ